MAIARLPLCAEKDCVDMSAVTAIGESDKMLRRDSPKSDTSRSLKSERDENATVAMYDVKNSQFRTIKRSEVEKLITVTRDLPRWSKKTKVFVPEPKDEKRHYYLATLNLGKLGLHYNLRRHLSTTRELYIIVA